MTSANIIINTVLMKTIPEIYRSRFFTIITFAEGLAVPLGLFVGGYLTDYLGVMKMFLAMGCGLFLLSILLVYCKPFAFLHAVET